MTRKKLNLAYIANDSMRKATFTKRKRGFLKKIDELSVLCGIQACALIYSPYSTNPEVYPSNLGVKNVVEKFEKLSEVEKQKKMVNHELFIWQSIQKAWDNNNKKMKENSERAMKEAMFMILDGNGDMLNLTNGNREELCKYIDQYIKELYHHRNETLNQPRFEYGESSITTDVMAPTTLPEVGSLSYPEVDALNSQLANGLWAMKPVLPLNQKQEEVSTFDNSFVSDANNQQGYYHMVNPVSNQFQDLNLNHHNQDGYPTMNQDGVYNPDEQEESLDYQQMMNDPDQMRLPKMDDESSNYPHQP